MTQVKIGKWGKDLAIRVPSEMAKALNLVEGVQVEIETRDGDLLVRRLEADTGDAAAAAEEIIAESDRYSLGPISIRELIDDGRRG